jgi:acetoin utilization protein AcuC
MTDGGDTTYEPWQPGEPASSLDRSIAQTRRQSFPIFGLDPDDPRD